MPFVLTEIQVESSTLPNPRVGDEAGHGMDAAVDVEDDEELTAARRGVATRDARAQRHGLVDADEAIKDVRAPVHPVPVHPFLYRVFGGVEAVQDAHPVGQPSAPHADYLRVQAEKNCAWKV